MKQMSGLLLLDLVTIAAVALGVGSRMSEGAGIGGSFLDLVRIWSLTEGLSFAFDFEPLGQFEPEKRECMYSSEMRTLKHHHGTVKA